MARDSIELGIGVAGSLVLVGYARWIVEGATISLALDQLATGRWFIDLVIYAIVVALYYEFVFSKNTERKEKTDTSRVQQQPSMTEIDD